MSAGTDAFGLHGRTALITGSSRGIGRILATALQDAGARVVLNARAATPLREAAAALGDRSGTTVPAFAFDVTDAAAVDAAVAEIEASVAPIDILVNNAGIQHREPLLEVSREDWDRVLGTNLTSAFLVGRAVARGMIERRAGKIINVASVQADLARPGIAPYTASKGGVRNLTRAMAVEWARHGLQVNALAPGYIHTAMTQALVDDEAFNAFIIGRTPAARWGRPEDLAGPAVWLASAASDFVNGQVIFVDGGMTVTV